MIAKEIAQYLVDNIARLTNLGGDVFVGQLPVADESGNKVQSGVYVVQAPGEGQDKYNSVMYANIDFWAVDPAYLTSYGLLEDVQELLSRNSNYVTTNYHIYFSHDVSDIVDMDRSLDGLKMYKMTIRFIYRNINVVS